MLTDMCFARSEYYLERAVASGVSCFVVDQVHELELIAKACPSAFIVLSVALSPSRDPYGISKSEVKSFVTTALSLGLKVR